MCEAHEQNQISDDHVVIGKELDLFHLGQDPAGMVYWHPAGLRIVHALEKLWRQSMGEWQEVKSPLMYGADIWERSGHLEKFRENMYLLEHGGAQYGLKPMNCPAHLQIFESQPRSYKELPLRYCELGQVHRAEQAGAIRGLLRVRAFVQDDGHILCAQDQVADEVARCLEIARFIYSHFDFEIKAELSLRPPQRFGDDELWDRSEEVLRSALEAGGWPYEESPGEGAFYGPKIDLHACDRLGRWWQLGSVQLDYVLPRRFDISYRGADNRLHVPVMIHRAAFGSLERFVGILLEQYDRQLPLWLSPRQIALVPVSSAHAMYAADLARRLGSAGLHADVLAEGSVGSRIARAHELGYWDVWVLGDREQGSDAVSSRRMSEPSSVSDVIARLQIQLQERQSMSGS